MLSFVDKRRNCLVSVFAYSILIITLDMSYAILFFYSSKYEVLRKVRIESELISKKLKWFLIVISDINIIVTTAISSLVFTSISVCYGLVCIYFDTLCCHLKVQIRNVKDSWDCGRIIYGYLKIRKIMESLEYFMCSSAFIMVVSTMTGLFYMSYNLIFTPKYDYRDYMCYLCGGMYHCSIIGIVIVSASAANSAAEGAKEAVMSLPGMFPKCYNELKVILIKDCKQQVCLTLWKIYKIDRSLIITAMGAQVNYGILVATLGTVSRSKDNI
ncbi:uncharacterized protein NPIL_457451 [Nephila pilipes]|uniref:Gustatory receptor n=1 Tax=Nephila pilipes TaxID=299642 RepID=A0A8X6QG55_NEPPI|nr:uncharacterized protein NPIL_457451 [Nephila pilipes]